MISIYVIENLIDHKYYIGPTNNPKRRRDQHFKKSHNLALRLDIKRLGKAKFTFRIIQTNIETTIEAEQEEYKLIAVYEKDNKIVYNIIKSDQQKQEMIKKKANKTTTTQTPETPADKIINQALNLLDDILSKINI